uniref:SAP domain-containing protein n=1 Tax=Meloidogyne incognita TaxID=6306 RepID=A0A914LS73_MELIC
MASKEELEKLTVAQIREKLKSRKLPASGPKSELVTRLFDSLMAEERLLEEGPGGESIDLSGVNMDEVLGLDDEKDTHSSITANEDIEEGKEKQPASCDNSDESMKNNDEEKGANKTDDRKEEEIKGKLITREDQTKRKGTTDEDVKMLKLAERVGLPVKRRVSESESDDILTKREKRFGSFSGNKEGEKILTKKDEEEAKEKRAARFGLTDEKRKTTDEDGKMLKRAERFGLPLKRGVALSESEQSEILAKREKRFGKVIGSGDTETKKEARIKRFGVVS